MLQLEWTKLYWRYWAVSWLLVVWGLAGERTALYAVTALCALQIIHFGIIEKSFTAFSVQVRIAVLMIFGIALAPGFEWIFWIPAIGLLARITIGYCLTARLVSLLPWNRSQKLSLQLIQQTLFSPPTHGSIKR